jgi:ADP-ribose pyrophosphatase
MLVSRKDTPLSPYVTLIERTVQSANGPQIYHGLGQADYVSILAVTPDGKIPLVKQYRPAVERETLELPGGLLDSEKTPAETALNELFEETGYRSTNGVQSLGCFDPDSGRLGNKFWGFYAADIMPAPNWIREADISVELVELSKLYEMIADGRFTMALHVALIGLAIMRNYLPADIAR